LLHPEIRARLRTRSSLAVGPRPRTRSSASEVCSLRTGVARRAEAHRAPSALLAFSPLRLSLSPPWDWLPSPSSLALHPSRGVPPFPMQHPLPGCASESCLAASAVCASDNASVALRTTGPSGVPHLVASTCTRRRPHRRAAHLDPGDRFSTDAPQSRSHGSRLLRSDVIPSLHPRTRPSEILRSLAEPHSLE